jgi:hypothetical protein
MAAEGLEALRTGVLLDPLPGFTNPRYKTLRLKESAMKAKPDRVSISVRVPTEVASVLARDAEAEDRTITAEVRRILRRHVEAQRPRRPRSPASVG